MALIQEKRLMVIWQYFHNKENIECPSVLARSPQNGFKSSLVDKCLHRMPLAPFLHSSLSWFVVGITHFAASTLGLTQVQTQQSI